MLNRKNLLAAALTSASLAALSLPTAAWAQASANGVTDCAEAVESTGSNPNATQIDPVTGNPIVDPVTGGPLLVPAGGTIPFTTQCGIGSAASGNFATAVGNSANAEGPQSSAFGFNAFALKAGAVAIGVDSFADSTDAVAVGRNAVVQSAATGSVALGAGSLADQADTVSIGSNGNDGAGGLINPAKTRRLVNVAAGTQATDAVNKQQLDTATADDKFIAFNAAINASAATASLDGAIAIGSGSEAGGVQSTAIGNFAKANESNSVALGSSANAGVNVSTIVPQSGTALGVKAKVKGSADNSVALGFGSIADEADVVSVGGGASVLPNEGPATRRIVNVANGTAANDAVNLGQLNGSFSAANTALVGVIDGRITAAGVGGAANPFIKVVELTGAADAQAVAGSVAIGGSADAQQAGSVALGEGSIADVANTVSVGSGTLKRKIVNVADGTATNDAVNLGQLNSSFSAANTALVGVINGQLTPANTALVGVIDGRLTSANPALTGLIDGRITAAGVGGAANPFIRVVELTGAANAQAVAGSVAIGGSADAQVAGAVALGEGSIANVADTVSVGNATLKRKIVNVADGTVSATSADAVTGAQLFAATTKNQFIGLDTTNFTGAASVGTDAVALGGGTNAAGLRSVALGSGSITASGDTDVVSLGGSTITLAGGGTGTLTRRLTNVAAAINATDAVNKQQLDDKFATFTGSPFIAVKNSDPTKIAVANGPEAIAIGQDAKSQANFGGGIAIGAGADLFRGSVAIGQLSFSSAQQSVVIGADAKALVGSGSSSRMVVLGDQAKVEATGSVALGFGSLVGTGVENENVVSFGSGVSTDAFATRRLINVKDGIAATDAATVGQLNQLRADFGIGGGAGGGVVVPGSVFVAVKEIAGAAAANAAVAGTVALGGNSKALAAETVAIGEGANAALAGATALGAGANAAGANATAIGRQASAALTNATAVGANSSVSLNADASVALGFGSTVTEANAVSIGSGNTADNFATRKLVNVTAGTAGTDAVNVNQLNEVKNLLTTGGVGNGFLAIDVAANANAANAAGAGSLALGGNAQALTANAVAVGNGATAKDGAAVSIGLGNIASGNGAVAIGDPNTATGEGAVALGFTNTATGVAAVALGSESQAVGDSAFAQGKKSNALGLSAIALGAGARAALDNPSIPPSNPPEDFASSNIAIGRAAAATGQTTIAIGNGAVADAEDATVIGDKSRAAFHATAIGGEVVASGAGSQAFGWQTNATGRLSTALGFRTNAVGASSLAVGANARSDFANSSAIGTGAVTTRADQIVLGRAAGVANGTPFKGTSVTIADIAASTAAQVGPTDVMTVDATGTIGRDATIRPAIASLQAGQQELFDLANLNRKEARRGIAAASALVAAPMPSEPGKTTVVGGTAFYRGEGAFSFSFNHRLNMEAPVSFGGGVAHSGGKDTVVRAHVATEF